MKFTLNKSQRLVTNAAAKEESRPVLACVHIRKGTIEAGNGYLLVQKQIDYDGDEELFLKAKEIAKCKDINGKVEFSVEGQDVKAVGRETVILKAKSGVFPDTDSLYPKIVSDEVIRRLSGQKPFRIALSRTQLLNLLNSLSGEIIRFYFYGGKQAIEFEVTDSAKGLIMPLDVQWEEK